MLRTSSFTSSSTISRLINLADENEVGDGKSDGNKMNLSIPFALKKFTKADYLTFAGNKRCVGNTKKGVKAAKSPNHLISAAKKTFNYL